MIQHLRAKFPYTFPLLAGLFSWIAAGKLASSSAGERRCTSRTFYRVSAILDSFVHKNQGLDVTQQPEHVFWGVVGMQVCLLQVVHLVFNPCLLTKAIRPVIDGQLRANTQ